MLPLLDTHQHLILPDVAGYAWTADVPVLAGRAFTLADYGRLTEGLGIAGTLFMEAGVDEGDAAAETRHVATLARDPAIRVLGLVASCRPERDEGFVAWLEEARALGAVGFRRILHVVDDDVSRTETFRANVRRIGDAGLTFDACFLARQLPLAAELARACENTRIVLDHCGNPDIASGALDPWRASIAELARLPNVACKLSGMLNNCPPRPATRATLAPYVDHLLGCFGPARMLWGSDWPVVDAGGGLPLWIAITRAILGTLSADEAAAIAHRTAAAVYGVKAP